MYSFCSSRLLHLVYPRRHGKLVVVVRKRSREGSHVEHKRDWAEPGDPPLTRLA